MNKQQQQFMLYELLRKGESPSWEKVIKKTKFPDMSIIKKVEEQRLPADNGSRWAVFLSTEGMTNQLITAINEENFSPREIDKTISVLEKWNQDVDTAFDYDEIHNLTVPARGEIGLGEKDIDEQDIINRIELVIEKALPKLKEFRQGQKQGAGQKGGQKGGKVYVKHPTRTLENIKKILDDDFENQTEEYQRAALLDWEDWFYTDNEKLKKWRKELTQQYGKMVRPIINKLGLHKFKNITVKTNMNLSDVGLKEQAQRRGFWAKRQIETHAEAEEIKDELRDKSSMLDPEGEEHIEKIRIKPLEVVMAFGIVSKIKEEKISKQRWELVEPFTSDSAVRYVNKLMKSQLFGGDRDIFWTKNLKEFRDKQKNIGIYLKPLLQEKFDAFIEDGTIIKNFLLEAQQLKFTDKHYRIKHWVNMAWDASNPYGNIDKKSPYYVDLSQFPEESEDRLQELAQSEIEKAIYKGKLKSPFEEETKKLEKSDKYRRYSISLPHKNYLDRLLSPKENERDLMEDIESQDLKDILEDLKEDYPEMRKVSFEYGDKSIEMWWVVQPKQYKKVDDAFELLGIEPAESDASHMYHDTLEDEHEYMTQFNVALKDRIDDVPFNKDKFEEGLEQDFAQLTYRILTSGRSLYDVLFDKPVFGQDIYDLSNLCQTLVWASRRYKTVGDLSDLAKMIKPKEESDFMADNPTYENEIKQFIKRLEKSVKDMRIAVKEDIKQKVKDIAENPEYFQTREKRITLKGRKDRQKWHSIYQILEQLKLIRRVRI